MGFLSARRDLKFSVPDGQKKLLGCHLLGARREVGGGGGGVSIQAETMN